MAACAPVLRFGVISDVQYCDTEDGTNFDGTEKRHYRGALDCLVQAVEHWNTLPDLQFVAQLGDLLDGQCAALRQCDAAMATVMALFGQCRVCDVYHCIGNHDLYNFDRPTLARHLRTARGPGGTGYYCFRPVPGWTVLVLDPYEEAIIGNSPDSVGYAAALEALQRHNPNDVLKGGGLLQGLEGSARRWVTYNGALGARQREWLREQVQSAAAAQDRVLVLSHVLLHPNAGDYCNVCFDAEEALAILHESECVVAVLCGHDHSGGYSQDAAGVHHVTFPSPLTCGGQELCHAHVDVHEDRLEIVGSGRVPSHVLPFVTSSDATPRPLSESSPSA